MTRMQVVPRILILTALAALVAAPLFAQESSASRPFGLDPYKPSDAKILRDFGPALVTRMSVDDLAKLDPYNPTDAALLRQLGGAIPLCCLELLPPIGPFSNGAYRSTVWHMMGSSPSTPEPHTAPSNEPRAGAKPAGNPNVVWVCEGPSCTAEDVRTHQFSKPPTGPDALPFSAPPAAADER